MAENNGITPVIEFKTIKVKHRIEHREIHDQIRAGKKPLSEDVDFVMRMVESWNLVDIETGEEIPLGEKMELTTVQEAQVIAAWNAWSDEADNEVKKTLERDDS